jgi:uncharacterized SAM-binding protein YcdF (DUF218 family)
MIARILALFFGLLTLVNLLAGLFCPGFNANPWLINFGRVLPAWFDDTVLAISAVFLLKFAFQNRRRGQRAPFTAAVAAALAAVALLNAISFYRLLAMGRIEAGFPLPLSLAVCGALLLIARSAWSESPADSRNRWMVAGCGLGLVVSFPLALMVFFGNTDYRRPADAVVVFGARTYQDGRMSLALQDRIRTACELYRAGLAKHLVLSGGRGDGAITEAQAMRHYALKHGVPAQDIFVDNEGVNTEATVRDTLPLFQQWHARRVLAVSHFYHLPRVKLAYQRAGMDVLTVPVHQGHLLTQLPFNMVREVAAFWDYYLKEKLVATVASA